MVVTVSKVEEKSSNSGKKFYVVYTEKHPKGITCWDEKITEMVGNTIEIEVTQNGKYTNMKVTNPFAKYSEFDKPTEAPKNTFSGSSGSVSDDRKYGTCLSYAKDVIVAAMSNGTVIPEEQIKFFKENIEGVYKDFLQLLTTATRENWGD